MTSSWTSWCGFFSFLCSLLEGTCCVWAADERIKLLRFALTSENGWREDRRLVRVNPKTMTMMLMIMVISEKKGWELILLDSTNMWIHKAILAFLLPSHQIRHLLSLSGFHGRWTGNGDGDGHGQWHCWFFTTPYWCITLSYDAACCTKQYSFLFIYLFILCSTCRIDYSWIGSGCSRCVTAFSLFVCVRERMDDISSSSVFILFVNSAGCDKKQGKKTQIFW